MNKRYLVMVAEWPHAGSVSEGTLRPDHLVVAFWDALKVVDPEGSQAFWREHWDTILKAIRENEEAVSDASDADMEAFDHTIEALELALGEACPPWYRFGMIDGDGACFGFWPFEKPGDDDYVIADVVRGGYLVSCAGTTLGHVPTWDDAERLILDDQEASGYFADVWYVNERGTCDLLEWKEDA